MSEVMKNIAFRIVDEGRVSLDRDSFDWLVNRAERHKKIADTWVAIEEHGTVEDAENFYSIVQDILEGDSNE